MNEPVCHCGHPSESHRANGACLECGCNEYLHATSAVEDDEPEMVDAPDPQGIQPTGPVAMTIGPIMPVDGMQPPVMTPFSWVIGKGTLGDGTPFLALDLYLVTGTTRLLAPAEAFGRLAHDLQENVSGLTLATADQLGRLLPPPRR